MGTAKPLRWKRKLAAVAASAISVAIFAGMMAAIATPSAAGSTAAPANYRQAVAAKLRRMVDVSTVRSPQISKPHMKFLGLFNGGTRPTVCVKLMRPNVLGMQGTYVYLFYFDDGRADGFQETATNFVQQAMNGCTDQQFTPFTELARSR
jgi:hypothetical protein